MGDRPGDQYAVAVGHRQQGVGGQYPYLIEI